jgi:two-component system chemotaxis response regulator CheY
MRILVLDDHKGFRQEVEAILARHGHDAHGVESADDAIPLAESGEYDFILVDFKMPVHDGLWFLKNVRLPMTTKALLVTAHVNKEIINKMFEMGAAGYIIKPFDEADLLRHLDFHWSGVTSVAETPERHGRKAPESEEER